MVPYRLALDLGSTSLGWACYELDKTDGGEPVSILDIGSRIFTDGRDSKKGSSLKADRRNHRQMRRQRDRRIQRTKLLLNTLIDIGLMPHDRAAGNALECEDPYPLRRQALDHHLPAYHTGRALFHLAQRRGFKSNRKTKGEEDGIIHKSVKEFQHKLKEAESRTVGEYLAKRREEKQAVRARRYGKTNDDLFDILPNRAMIEAEFDLIWQAQAGFDPELFTEDRRERLRRVMFHQRPLKPVTPGRCQFFPDEPRIAKASLTFQKFRILQELNNLAWIDDHFIPHKFTANKPLYDAVLSDLLKKKSVAFKSLRTLLNKLNITEHEAGFNLESEKRSKLDGDKTAAAMRARSEAKSKPGIGVKWNEFTDQQKHRLISLLLDEEDRIIDDELVALLLNEFSLSQHECENCLLIALPDSHGNLSEKAINILNPIMEDQGLTYAEAVKEAKDNGYFPPQADVTTTDRLDYYGKVIEGDVTGGTGRGTPEQKYGTIPNPTVHIALNQVRDVVNELIRFHGKPTEIVIELARDLPLGAKSKAELEKQQAKHQEKNDEIEEVLKSYNRQATRYLLQKYKLWEELCPNDVNGRRCVFTGHMISIYDLLSEKTEIEHLLPRAQTFDDSMANKTVCFSQANRDKGNNAPYQAFAHSPPGYNWNAILQRVQNLPKNKQRKFTEHALAERLANGGFIERQLNDTRYISRYTRAYLTSLIPENKIWVVTGQLTSDVRHHLGMNRFLKDHNQISEGTPKKNRNDHRHHAVDALVIGLISRSLLQRAATEAARNEGKTKKIFEGKQLTPWEGFDDDARAALSKLRVSHRMKKKAQGKLLKETAYSLNGSTYEPNDASEVYHRIPVSEIKTLRDINQIKDERIREDLEAEVYYVWEDKKELEAEIASWFQKQGIRRIKIKENKSVRPIRDKNGRIFKAYEAQSNAFMDIYIHPKTGRWTSETVSRFDANSPHADNPDFIPYWQRRFPHLKRLMRLRINSLLSLREDGREVLYRVQRLSGNTITLSEIHEANNDARNRAKKRDDYLPFVYKAASSLQNAQARLVHISPTGRIRRMKIPPPSPAQQKKRQR